VNRFAGLPLSVEPDELERLRDGLRLATQQLDMDLGIISHVRGETYTVLCTAGTPEIAPGTEFPFGDTYCSMTLAADGVVSIDEMASSEHKGHPCYEAFGLESYIGIPIRLQGEPLGTLNFSSPAPRNKAFSEADTALIRLLAMWVEQALEAARLRRTSNDVKASLEAIFTAAPDGIVIHDNEVVLRANPALATMVGYDSEEELVGRPVFDFVPHESDRQTAAVRIPLLARGITPTDAMTLKLRGRQGREIWVESRGAPIEMAGKRCVLAIVRDLTPRDDLIHQEHAQRMAALGSLAAGMAHELRDPLGVVLANLDYLAHGLQRLEPSHRRDALQEACEDAQRSSDAIQKLVSDIQVFSRHTGERNMVEVEGLIATALNLVSSRLRRTELVIDVGNCPPLVCDERGMVQVLVNLITNALDAMEDGAGVLKIDAHLVSTDVQLTVSDNGPGIPDEVLPKIFNRFFTTKPANDGTGLGLTLAEEIIAEHRGRIAVCNAADGGAVFTVSLPATSVRSVIAATRS